MNSLPEPVVDTHSEPERPLVQVLIPRARRQHGVLLIRSNQAPLNLQRIENPGLPQQANNNYLTYLPNVQRCVKIIKRITPVNPGSCMHTDVESRNDNPIDLSTTSTDAISSSSSTALTLIPNVVYSSPEIAEPNPKTGQIGLGQHLQVKRKNSSFAKEMIYGIKRNTENWVGHVRPSHGIPRQAGSKREEVLKAARSLFSKRTRTLYHWLRPSTSKSKLKSSVAAAWETLSTGEKDFYISQVLGRFGVPACSLMVNPQLGTLRTEEMTAVDSISSPGTSSTMGGTQEVASNVVVENDVPWSSYAQRPNESELTKKRSRYHQTNKDESITNTQDKSKEDEEILILKQIHDASMEEDFANDPELSTEFEQFRDESNYDNELFSDVLHETLL